MLPPGNCVRKDLRLEPPFFQQLDKPAGLNGPCHGCYPQDPVTIVQVKVSPVPCKGPVDLLYQYEGLHPVYYIGLENFYHACKVSSLQTYGPPPVLTGGNCDILSGRLGQIKIPVGTKTLVKDRR